MSKGEHATRYTGMVGADMQGLLAGAVNGSGALQLSIRAVLDMLIGECTDDELVAAMDFYRPLEGDEYHCRIGIVPRKRLAAAAKKAGTPVNHAVDCLMRRMSRPLHAPVIWTKLSRAAKNNARGGAS